MSISESDIESLLQGSQSLDSSGRTLAQRRIDDLDRLLASVDPSSSLYARTLPRFRAMCRRSGCLPTSCYLTEEIVLEDQYPLHQTALSDVFKGRMGRLQVAIKSIRLYDDNRTQREKSFYGEVMAWRCLRHPNITPFLGVSDIFSICLVSKWMVNGNIADFLKKRPLENRAKYARDILEGLQYMHSLNIVHGDLKSLNVLVDEHLNACLADFGLVSLLQTTNTVSADSSYLGGTVRWTAPEVLQGGRPTLASDMYSVSVVLWELFTGKLPFDDVQSGPKVIIDVMAGRQLPKPKDAIRFGCTSGLWTTMQQSWSLDPAQRPQCRRLLSTVSTVNALNQVASLDADATSRALIRVCEGESSPESPTEVLAPLGLLLWKVTVANWANEEARSIAGPELFLPLRRLLSAVLTFGLDERTDRLCRERLQVGPSLTSDPRKPWSISPIASAVRLLVIMAALQRWVALNDHANDAKNILHFYANSLDGLVGPSYQKPCLAFLARCWLETSENWWVANARKASRTTFHHELAKMGESELISLVMRWEKEITALPSVEPSKPFTSVTAFAMCAHASLHVHKSLPPEVLLKMSISLQQHLQSSDTAHCSLAIDLCWRGVAIWKKFVSLTNIFRTLVALAFPSEDESNSPTWENRKQARPAILEIAQRSSSSFMRTLISELGNFSSPVLRKLGSLVRFLAEKIPTTLFPKVPDIIEAAMTALQKSLEATHTTVQSHLEGIVFSLYNSFPNVDIHAPSQRLVVGVPNGAVIAYNMHRGKPLGVLDAHHGTPIGCSFSPNGRWLVTLSVQESVVNVWKIPTKWDPGRDPGARLHKSGYFDSSQLGDVSLAEILKETQFKWSSQDVVVISVRDSTMTFSMR